MKSDVTTRSGDLKMGVAKLVVRVVRPLHLYGTQRHSGHYRPQGVRAVGNPCDTAVFPAIYPNGAKMAFGWPPGHN